MNIVSVINYKGGVGKTSITTNLAGELAWRGFRVLVIDLDPQASLTFSFIRAEDWQKTFAENGTIKAWFDALLKHEDFKLPRLIFSPRRVKERLAGRGVLDIICSHLGLINVDLELATLLGGSSMRQVRENFIAVHRRLADGLAQVNRANYDIVLIDCPPNFNIVTKTALVASDFVLVPTRPDYLSTLGIDYLIKNINDLVKDYNEFASSAAGKSIDPISPSTIGVVFNMVQEMNGGPINAQMTYIEQIRRQSGLQVFDSYIKRNDTIFAQAPETGIPVVLNGYSNASHQNVVGGLEQFVTDFVDEIGLKK